MQNKYIKMTSLLVTLGAIFFSGAAYSDGAAVGQPQFDASLSVERRALADAPMRVAAPADVTAQANAGSSGAKPLVNDQRADRDVFREDAAAK